MSKKAWTLAAFALGLGSIIATYGCDVGGKEGDTCNANVLRDECDEGLSCTAVSCTRAVCCPPSGGTDEACRSRVVCEEDAGEDAKFSPDTASPPTEDATPTDPDAGSDADAAPPPDPDAAPDAEIDAGLDAAGD